MDNLNKLTDTNNYDLILEEKEKQLKKEKRNKIILALTLSGLLLLGSAAVVAPIVSVAVNNTNKNISDTVIFSDEDITKLINNYKNEIQIKKLILGQFQRDFLNITKKYLTASNINISNLIKSASINKKILSNNEIEYDIIIELDNTKIYLSNNELTKATLKNNYLTFTLKKGDDLNFFYHIPGFTLDVLNNFKEQLQKYIKDNNLTKQVFETNINNNSLKSEIIKMLNPVEEKYINEIKFENSKLIITGNNYYIFVLSETNNLINNGNIEISDLKFS